MMNLGDALLCELENGKPKLVLAKYEISPPPVNETVRYMHSSYKHSK